MSYVIMYTCEWCGEEHKDTGREIKGFVGNSEDFEIGDLCHGCYRKLSRALKARSDIVTNVAITFNTWLISVFVAAGLGALICGVIRTL